MKLDKLMTLGRELYMTRRRIRSLETAMLNYREGSLRINGHKYTLDHAEATIALEAILRKNQETRSKIEGQLRRHGIDTHEEPSLDEVDDEVKVTIA